MFGGGGQKRIFAPDKLPFPHTYHVKGGQFGGGGWAKTYFCPEKLYFCLVPPPLDPPVGRVTGGVGGS